MLKITLLTAGALLGLIGIAAADPQPATPDVPAVFKPAQREGYFFVGGRYETVGGKDIAIGQMFVQYHAPEKVTQPYLESNNQQVADAIIDWIAVRAR
jgi:hypothetical protein